MGVWALVLFFIIFVLILRGYPVAFTLGGVSTLFALTLVLIAPETIRIQDFYLLPGRFMGTINNSMLMAVPLFIYMGIMLEKSGVAAQLLETMAGLFGKFRGGLAISVIIVGALLAASTGIVGATVVTMGLISLPTMLKRGYKPELATGVIASSGTLGQIIPPSVVLILLADQISSSSKSSTVDVGSLFQVALIPGGLFVLAYITYVMIISKLKPDWAPLIPASEIESLRGDRFILQLLKAFLLPILLIIVVLGSIFTGIASPTEAASVGAVGAILLTIIQRKFNISILREVMEHTIKLTAMVFFILLGATSFTLIFRTLGGDEFLIHAITQSDLSPMVFLLIVMIIVFIAGFFIDFIEIIFIFVPVITPIFDAYDINMLWVGVLLAINLQTSFLTPPFGFSLFYLKGVAPPEITTAQLYRGIIPFIFIQIIFLFVIFMFPQILGIEI